MKNLKTLIQDESGVGVIEYVVLSATGAALALAVGVMMQDATTGMQANIAADATAASGAFILGTN